MQTKELNRPGFSGIEYEVTWVARVCVFIFLFSLLWVPIYLSLFIWRGIVGNLKEASDEIKVGFEMIFRGKTGSHPQPWMVKKAVILRNGSNE